MPRKRKTDLSKVRYLDENNNDNPSEVEEKSDEEKLEDSSADKEKSEPEEEINPPALQAPAPQDQARTIAQLMRVIQQQNAQMQVSQNAMNQLQSEAAIARQRDVAAAQQQLTEAQAKVANVSAARLAGGVYSYKNGNALSGNKRGSIKL